MGATGRRQGSGRTGRRLVVSWTRLVAGTLSAARDRGSRARVRGRTRGDTEISERLPSERRERVAERGARGRRAHSLHWTDSARRPTQPAVGLRGASNAEHFPQSFGMVAVEAAACGALPLSARHSGMAEVSAMLARALPEQLRPLL